MQVNYFPMNEVLINMYEVIDKHITTFVTKMYTVTVIVTENCKFAQAEKTLQDHQRLSQLDLLYTHTKILY